MLATLLAAGAFLVQAGYWGILYVGFRRARQSTPGTGTPPMSVVVAARNEAETLPTLLRALTRQTHPHFEVVVVDDASKDATAEVARRHAASHPNVRLVHVSQPRSPRKKHALTRGIAAARHDLLAFTDADCAPPPEWLSTLAHLHAASDEDLLLVGYSPYRRRRDLLGRLASYETFVTGFLTAAAAGLGRAYMAVGRNVSYPRRVFDRVGGFEHSRMSLSGDDDLLVQEVQRRGAGRIRAVLDPQSFVPTDAPPEWRAWMRQKRRHTSAGRFYRRSVQLHLAAFQSSGVLLWTAPLWAGLPGLALLIARLGIQAGVLYDAADTLDERDHLPALPVLDLLYAAYNLIVAPLGLSRMPQKW